MCVRVEERGWTYNTQCLVETEATYTRFPGVMGKDRVIRMHSSSSRLNKRDIRAHTHTRVHAGRAIDFSDLEHVTARTTSLPRISRPR